MMKKRGILKPINKVACYKYGQLPSRDMDEDEWMKTSEEEES